MSRVKWEYKTTMVNIVEVDVAGLLNRLGADGWELIATRQDCEGEDSNWVRLRFRRSRTD